MTQRNANCFRLMLCLPWVLFLSLSASADWLPPHLNGSAVAVSTPPHPAVARIIVPERDGTAFGSGTLIDSRDEYGLVLTNWHVVRDATGPIEVHFPGGFQSQARAIKLDSEWDLAALVVWRPPAKPVPLASRPPRPGDRLTIAGYGRGNYREASGTCTQFYSPRIDLPKELVELDVQARQGDSGGPIFNEHGELAGVLFGAGQGTTIGSFEGRVKTFLATLAPNIGHRSDDAPQVALAKVKPQRVIDQPQRLPATSDDTSGRLLAARPVEFTPLPQSGPALKANETGAPSTTEPPLSVKPHSTPLLWESVRNILACVGVVSLLVQLVRWAG
jgi:hypothetical protein